jgi:hypothetical protein
MSGQGQGSIADRIASLPEEPAGEREVSRQQSLDLLSVLDTGAEASFDGLVQAAAAICGTPITIASGSRPMWAWRG